KKGELSDSWIAVSHKNTKKETNHVYEMCLTQWPRAGAAGSLSYRRKRTIGGVRPCARNPYLKSLQSLQTTSNNRNTNRENTISNEPVGNGCIGGLADGDTGFPARSDLHDQGPGHAGQHRQLCQWHQLQGPGRRVCTNRERVSPLSLQQRRHDRSR